MCIRDRFLQDAESFVRVHNIFNPENFDRTIKPVAEFIQEHLKQYDSLPTLEMIQAATNVKLNKNEDFNQENSQWLIDSFESFTKQKELERAIVKSYDLLEKGDYALVEKLIKDAVQISLMKDLGTDYFDDPRARLMKLKNSNGQNSTGWPTLDRLLYGGFNRGELQIFAGGSGSGK